SSRVRVSRRACQTDVETRVCGRGMPVTEQPPKARRIGWFMFPLIGMATVVVAHGVRGALAWRGSVELWHAADPWLPTIIPAHADYTVAPWPMYIWASMLLSLGLLLAILSSVILRVVPVRYPWLRAILLWGSSIASAVGVVSIAELGQWLLVLPDYGGLAGLYIRSFTVPSLLEAARWGLLWGWIP